MAFKISLADALFKSYSKIVTELEIQHNVKLKPTKGEADKLLSYQRKRKWVWKKAGGWKRNKLLEKTPEFLWQVNDVGFQNQVPTENGHLPKQDEEPAAEKQTLQNHVDPSKVVPASVAKACERRRLANSNVTKSPTEASSHCARRQHWREPCPQVGSMRRGSNESHHWRHPFYSDMGCDYCDFSAQENHLMMEHYRVHFRPGKHVKAESYTELVNLEVFMKEVNAEEDAVSGCLGQKVLSGTIGRRWGFRARYGATGHIKHRPCWELCHKWFNMMRLIEINHSVLR